MNNNLTDFRIIKYNKPINIRTIVDIQQDLLSVLNANQAVAVELPDDCQVDISFVQLMEAARRYARASGKDFKLLKPARGSVLDVLQRGGFLDAVSAEDAHFWLHEGQVQ